MSLLWRRRSDLHPDQINAIDGLPPLGKYLLVGPPGSGKTSILLHRGQYLRLAPHSFSNVRLITFSRTLREFIAVSGDERFPPGLIQTVWEFVDEIFETYHAPKPVFSEGTSLVEKNRIRAVEALELVSKMEKRVTYDGLLIDEIQDLSPEEIELFDSLSESTMMVGDNRQKLFEAGDGLETAEELKYTKIELKHHFRISREISKVADAILLPGDFRLVEYCHYQGPTPSPPTLHPGLNGAAQLNKLLEALDLQLDTYNDPTDLIGIITARIDGCNAIKSRLNETRFGEITKVFHSDTRDRSFPRGVRICIVPVQSCKGLEFRALHWLMPSRDPYVDIKERAYTVVTRAKSSLTVYHNEDLPGYLSGAFPTVGRTLFEDDR